jgi:peroxiredoxin Q/BCP
MAAIINEKAPDFTLPTDSGAKLSLADLHGKRIVLYFYPKDDTPGCTTEACSFGTSLPHFSQINAEILGISKDSPSSHQKFKQKYQIPFTLLSDKDAQVCEAYGVLVEKSRFGKKYKGIERSTFLIDEKGIIRAIWRSVKVDGHTETVLKKLQEF